MHESGSREYLIHNGDDDDENDNDDDDDDNGDDDDGESGNSFTSYYAKAPSPLENHTACFPETQFRQNHSFDPRKK